MRIFKKHTVLIALLTATAVDAAAVQPAVQPPEGAKVVYPEVATQVPMSNTDINRLVCSEPIKTVVYSEEKGVVAVETLGKSAYVKFAVDVRSRERRYVVEPTEFFVVCGDATYNIIAMPQRGIPAQTIYLSSGRRERIKQNAALFGAMPYEDKLISILRKVYTGEIPESFEVRNKNKTYDLFRDVMLTLVRIVDVVGEGLRVLEYQGTLRNGVTGPIQIKERDFLLPELTRDPAAIQIDEHSIAIGSIARILIVERTNHETQQ